jgi:hypothetical protein
MHIKFISFYFAPAAGNIPSGAYRDRGPPGPSARDPDLRECFHNTLLRISIRKHYLLPR